MKLHNLYKICNDEQNPFFIFIFFFIIISCKTHSVAKAEKLSPHAQDTRMIRERFNKSKPLHSQTPKLKAY